MLNPSFIPNKDEMFDCNKNIRYFITNCFVFCSEKHGTHIALHNITIKLLLSIISSFIVNTFLSSCYFPITLDVLTERLSHLGSGYT